MSTIYCFKITYLRVQSFRANTPTECLSFENTFRDIVQNWAKLWTQPYDIIKFSCLHRPEYSMPACFQQLGTARCLQKGNKTNIFCLWKTSLHNEARIQEYPGSLGFVHLFIFLLMLSCFLNKCTLDFHSSVGRIICVSWVRRI